MSLSEVLPHGDRRRLHVTSRNDIMSVADRRAIRSAIKAVIALPIICGRKCECVVVVVDACYARCTPIGLSWCAGNVVPVATGTLRLRRAGSRRCHLWMPVVPPRVATERVGVGGVLAL